MTVVVFFLVFPMFMKGFDGSGLVKLGKIALALLPCSALLHGEDENGLMNSFFSLLHSVEKILRCYWNCFICILMRHWESRVNESQMIVR